MELNEWKLNRYDLMQQPIIISIIFQIKCFVVGTLKCLRCIQKKTKSTPRVQLNTSKGNCLTYNLFAYKAIDIRQYNKKPRILRRKPRIAIIFGFISIIIIIIKMRKQHP